MRMTTCSVVLLRVSSRGEGTVAASRWSSWCGKARAQPRNPGWPRTLGKPWEEEEREGRKERMVTSGVVVLFVSDSMSRESESEVEGKGGGRKGEGWLRKKRRG